MLMNIRKSMKSQKGFTLVELMIVIVIIGILAAIAVPKLSGSTAEANLAKAKADVRTVQSAVAIYYAKNSAYPTSATFAALVTDLNTAGLLQDTTITVATGHTYTYDKTTGAVAFTTP